MTTLSLDPTGTNAFANLAAVSRLLIEIRSFAWSGGKVLRHKDLSGRSMRSVGSVEAARSCSVLLPGLRFGAKESIFLGRAYRRRVVVEKGARRVALESDAVDRNMAAKQIRRP